MRFFSKAFTGVLFAVLIQAVGMFSIPSHADPVDIGSRLELFVDEALIESMEGCALRLHHPTPREVVVVHDEPWEGSGSGYHTIFKDGDLFRMYYKAWELSPEQGKLSIPHDTFAAYAESRDGIVWTKPNLGLFGFEGSKENNIVWIGKGGHDFTPFKDANPDCAPEARYKAIGYGPNPTGAYGFQSADGIHWEMISEDPILTGAPFDTQNLAFWDTLRGEYRAYIRAFSDGGESTTGLRGIKTTTSRDFKNWSALEWLAYPGAPAEQLYTNQVKPYYRAPHLFIGFPARYVERGWSDSMEALPEPEHRRLRASSTERYGTALTDSLFMTSRDGKTFKRWGEAFLRPGLRGKDNWKYGDNYIAWHTVETKSAIPDAPNELSLYATESYWTGKASALRRFTLRVDGFVSMEAPLSGGAFTTKPIRFAGDRLHLNFSTSAAGTIRVEVQDLEGEPIEGYALDDCSEVFGDDLDRVVTWKDGADLSALAGKTVRLRFELSDADLYSFQFK